jgi:hypothetical protein
MHVCSRQSSPGDARAEVNKQVMESSTGWTLKRIFYFQYATCMKRLCAHIQHLTRASKVASCKRGLESRVLLVETSSIGSTVLRLQDRSPEVRALGFTETSGYAEPILLLENSLTTSFTLSRQSCVALFTPEIAAMKNWPCLFYGERRLNFCLIAVFLVDYVGATDSSGEPGNSVYCLATDLTTVRSRFDPQQRRKDFSSSLCVQTGSGALPASGTVGTGGPFPGAKARPGRDPDHSPPSSA